MKLVDTGYYLDKVVNPLSRVCHGIGSVILAFMMFITAADVCLRYFFNRPIMGAYELTEITLVVWMIRSAPPGILK